MQTKGSYVEFEAPQGWSMPEASENGEFDLVCTFRSKGGSRVCMVKFGEMPMPEKSEKEKAPDYKEVSAGIASEMNSAIPE